MIVLRRGDLWESEAEVIVREATVLGEARSAVGRRTELEIGAEVLKRVAAMGEMQVGSAVLTPGGNLPSSFALHIFLTSHEEPITARGVEKGLRNALARVSDFGIGSVAFPPVGLGAGSLETESAAGLLVSMLRTHLETGNEPQQFEIVVDNDYEEDVFSQALGVLENSDAD